MNRTPQKKVKTDEGVKKAGEQIKHNTLNQTQNVAEEKKAAERDILAAFNKNKKTMRSPVETPRSTGGTRVNIDYSKENAYDEEEEVIVGQLEAPGGSPRQEFIVNMRISEEEALGRCKKALRKVRQAMNKQRTVNMDVQNGIAELEELFDVIEDYRRNWQKAEKERDASEKARGIDKNIALMDERPTPSTSLAKRGATSPADMNP